MLTFENVIEALKCWKTAEKLILLKLSIPCSMSQDF